MTSELRHRDPVEMLGEEFLARRRRGENPQIEQFIDANRRYADQIRALFPAMIAMEDLKVSKNESADRPIRLHVDRLERLGDYRIVREIGHGGMGIVYEAEQQSLHRRVAVKVFPKQAIGDTQQLKRFQREAETVGALHHTNIVPVFGVGQQDGLHYFVMQFLDGVSLDRIIHGLSILDPKFRSNDYLQHVFDLQMQQHSWQQGPSHEQHSPSQETDDLVARDGLSVDAHPVDVHPGDVIGRADVTQRENFGKEHWRRIADIGIQVAEALQYAHSKGVMHRDIKPGNLILGCDARVWVTDFGLAVSPEQERLSRSGDVVGTLRYMSPEQLNGHCDHRSDVYGLGLTLYELMTLRPAFEGESRGSLIRKVAKSSPASPRAMCREIPRDLETVILKAIARSPDSRYKSAEDFAADLRRFRSDQPIRARRISGAERLCRWSRRNPALAGMSLALIFGAVLSFAAVSWNWRQAVQEKQNAESQGSRAENNLTLALRSMDRLLERFESDWMSHPAAESGTGDSGAQLRFVVSDHSAAVLEEALVFYDQFAQQNANSPKLQRDTAKAHRRVGDILERLGRHADSERAYRQSADALLMQMDANRGDTDLVAQTAAVLNRLALVLHEVYRSEEAKHELDQAQRMLTDVLSRGERSLPCIYQLARTNSNLGLVLWRMHEGEESARRHRRAILLLEGLAEENPFDAKYKLALARAYRNYYPIAAACKEPLYADQIRVSAANILEQLVSDFPNVPDYQCELSEMLTMTVAAESTHGGAEIDRAVQLAKNLHRQFPSIPRYETALAQSLTSQASLLRESDPERASAIHQRATDLFRQLSVRFPDVPAYRAFIASALREYGVTLKLAEQWEESICVLEEAVSEQADYLQARPDSLYGRKSMSGHLRHLAEVLELTGETQRASEVKDHANSFWKQRPTVETVLESR